MQSAVSSLAASYVAQQAAKPACKTFGWHQGATRTLSKEKLSKDTVRRRPGAAMLSLSIGKLVAHRATGDRPVANRYRIVEPHRSGGNVTSLLAPGGFGPAALAGVLTGSELNGAANAPTSHPSVTRNG